MSVSSSTIAETETFAAAGNRARSRGWGGSTALSLALTIAGLALSSSAQAWGVCGRGPWVEEPGARGSWSAQSMCSCSNGQRGNIMVQGSILNAYVAAWGSASGGGVGAEIEAFDTWTQEVVWIGLNFYPYPYKLAQPNGTEVVTRFGRPPIDGGNAGRYAPRRRYRSVCITNIKSLPSYPSYPWFWNG